MTLKNIFQVLVKITWQQKRRGKKSTPAKEWHIYFQVIMKERERERESERERGQPNQFIVGLAGVLEQEVTENEQTDKYRPLK